MLSCRDQGFQKIFREMADDAGGGVVVVEVELAPCPLVRSPKLLRRSSEEARIEEENGGAEQEYATGHASKFSAISNFVNTIIGAGIIGLPFALYQTGFWTGILLISLAAVLVDSSSNMLVECGLRRNRLNYEELAEAVFGVWGFQLFCFFAFIMAFGAQAAYLILLGDTTTTILSSLGSGLGEDRQAIILLFSLFLCLPLSMLRDIHKLAFTSLLSVLSDFFIILIVLFLAPGESRSQASAEGLIDRSEALTFIRPTLFAGFGAISFAFVCQSSTFIVFRSLKEPSLAAWESITRWSVGIAWLMALSLAIVGSLSFVNTTEGDILNNFSNDSPAANAARGFLAVTMVFTYPMEMFVARHVLNASICEKILGWGKITIGRHVVITLAVWASTTALALATQDLGVVLEIFGAFSASVIGYVLPALIFLKCREEEVRATWRKESWSGRLASQGPFLMAYFMAVFGIIAMVAGTVSTLVDSWSGSTFD